jgi:hypothetical protein
MEHKMVARAFHKVMRAQTAAGGRRSARTSSAHPVQLEMCVLDVWSSDVKTESFCAKLQVRMRWVCPTVHAEESMEHGGDFLDTDWEPEWFPRMVMDSCAHAAIESQHFMARREDSIVWITGEWVLSVQVLESYDLHAFPFDVQDFNLSLRIDNAPAGIELKCIDPLHSSHPMGPHPHTPWDPTLTPHGTHLRCIDPLHQRGGKVRVSRVNHAQGGGRSSLDDPGVITEKPVRIDPLHSSHPMGPHPHTPWDPSQVRIEAAGLDLPDFRPVDDKKANWWARGKRWLISPALFKLCDTGDEVHVVLLCAPHPHPHPNPNPNPNPHPHPHPNRRGPRGAALCA